MPVDSFMDPSRHRFGPIQMCTSMFLHCTVTDIYLAQRMFIIFSGKKLQGRDLSLLSVCKTVKVSYACIHIGMCYL